jgi:dipeptidyl aminopeptidase/acylaminoacyl peptidase
MPQAGCYHLCMNLTPLSRGLVRVLAFSVLVSLPACAQKTAEASPATHAQEQIGELLRSMSGGQSIGQVAISPNGKRLAWTEGGQIYLAPFGALSQSRTITAAVSAVQSCTEDGLTWSPDSTALAFFSDCANPGAQTDLYLASVNGGDGVTATRLLPRRLTKLHGYVDAPAFSPDGSRIAFLYVEGATRPAGALAAMKPFAGVIGEEGIEIQRVAVAAADAPEPAAPAFVSPANLHVYEFDWSPDSKSVAYVAADPPGENNWWVAKLYTQTIGAAPRAILAPAEVAGPLHGLQMAVPRWSPDGSSIAFIGGLMSDQGATGGDVWVVSADGGEPRNLTPGRTATAVWIEWGDGKHIFVDELAGGDARLVSLGLTGDPGSGTASAGEPIFSLPGEVGDGRLEMSLSANSAHTEFVFHASTFDRPPEIYAAVPGTATAQGFDGVQQLTHLNGSVEPQWGKTVSVEWTSDGFPVQGWLLLPRGFNPAQKYPLIVQAHGGPAAAAAPHWGVGSPLSVEAFSMLGYFVLLPNPRGSYGQGEAFTQANRKDFGYGDLRDILAGVDAVEAKYPIDPKRVGLDGWSYGGFMTMFAVTQTHRFQAAVAGAGISDWLSYYGENSIDQWMIPYFGASVYDDPAVYARSSAIDFIKQAGTPTLIVVGDRDGECPAPQSFEFWHALRDLHVSTEFVVYPNEGHGFVDPAHRQDVLERSAAWFARYMPPGP